MCKFPTVNFVDSKPVVLLWGLILLFEFILYLINIYRNSRFRDNPENFGDRIILKNNDQHFFSFNRIIKSNLLYDKEYFKNSERTHLLLVQSIGISLNACLVIILLFWLLSKYLFPSIHLADVSSDALIKAILFFVSSVLAIYWNLKTDQNKKFDYCLTTYNGINKDKDLTKISSEIELREACLALDILTMDLWPKRILSTFFSRILKEAINNDQEWKKAKEGRLSQNEAYSFLLEYAKRLNDKKIKN